MIILDTNVLSALMQQAPDPNVLAWLDQQPRSSIWTTAITVLEIRFGLQILAAGKRRTLLMQGFDVLLEKIGQRIAPFDDAAAQQAANLMAPGKTGPAGRLAGHHDRRYRAGPHATLATRNTSHFEDISSVVNPWTA